MAKYFYDKYTSIASNYYYSMTVNKPPTSTNEIELGIGDRDDVSNSPTTFLLNSTKGSYSTPMIHTNQLNATFYMLGSKWGGTDSLVEEYEKTKPWTSWQGFCKATRIVKEAQFGTSYSRGDYLNQIIAEDGIYPLDGRHSDGYWYVRRGLAFPEFNMRINGVLKVSENGWVRINGTLREIDTIQVRVNGSLKEV